MTNCICSNYLLRAHLPFVLFMVKSWPGMQLHPVGRLRVIAGLKRFRVSRYYG